MLGISTCITWVLAFFPSHNEDGSFTSQGQWGKCVFLWVCVCNIHSQTCTLPVKVFSCQTGWTQIYFRLSVSTASRPKRTQTHRHIPTRLCHFTALSPQPAGKSHSWILHEQLSAGEPPAHVWIIGKNHGRLIIVCMCVCVCAVWMFGLPTTAKLSLDHIHLLQLAYVCFWHVIRVLAGPSCAALWIDQGTNAAVNKGQLPLGLQILNYMLMCSFSVLSAPIFSMNCAESQKAAVPEAALSAPSRRVVCFNPTKVKFHPGDARQVWSGFGASALWLLLRMGQKDRFPNRGW